MLTTKEYLYQLKDIDNLINSNQEEVDKLKTLATNISVTYSDEPHGSGTSDKVGNTVVKIVDLQNEINDLIDELVDIKTDSIKIINKIQKLKQRTVLIKYYLHNKSFEQTAVEMDITYQWTCELHGRALVEFEKIKKKK